MGKKLIYGVGFNGNMKYGARTYNLWNGVLRRAHQEEFKLKYPTYRNATVCERWHDYELFVQDIQEMEGYGHWLDNDIRMSMDKDILIEGNTHYSRENCIFVPHSVNGFMTNKKSDNTSGYTGVSWSKSNKKWAVCIAEFGAVKRKSINLGSYDNKLEAAQAYVEGRIIQAITVKNFMRELGYSDNVIEGIR